MPPSTIIHLVHIVAVLRRSPTTVASSTSSPRRRADDTLPRALLDREFAGRHRVERVLNAEVPYVRCLDRLDREEDVRLLPLRCVIASAVGLRWYVDNTLPSLLYIS